MGRQVQVKVLLSTIIVLVIVSCGRIGNQGDINKGIDNCNDSIASRPMDGFCGFPWGTTKEEIIASIKRANIADDTYLNGVLVIQDNQKHNPLPVIDKDFYGDFNVYSYLKEKLDDKNKISNIINKFSAIIKDERISKDFKEYLKSGNIEIALNILFDLPYLNIRKFIIYLVEERAKEQVLEIEPELVRDKAA